MRIRYYRDGRGAPCIEADPAWLGFADFIRTEVGQDGNFCSGVLESASLAARGVEWTEIGDWNVHVISAADGRVRIESIVGSSEPCEVSIEEFRWALSDWRDFVSGHAESGWRVFEPES